MTVPFIMALGVGVSAVRNDREAGGDSFGLVALCSIGPIITVLLLGLLYQPDGSTYTPVSVPDAKDTAEMFRSYTHALRSISRRSSCLWRPFWRFSSCSSWSPGGCTGGRS